MVAADDRHVARRLRELLSWADYIVECLCRDQSYETGTIDLLELRAGEEDLRELRQRAWALREKLQLAATRIELSAPAAPPPRSCA